MSRLPRPNGLLLKLAAFFLICGLPALLALDLARSAAEFRRVSELLESQAMLDEVRREAAAIGRHRREHGLSGIGLARDLERWSLTLAQPASSPLGAAAWSLLQYSPRPFSAMLLDADGAIIASSRAKAKPPSTLPDTPPRDGAAVAVDLPGRQRLYRASLRGPNGAEETLLLSVELPSPTSHLWRALRQEWPIVFVGAAVFASVAAVFLSAWVTRRLRRIAATTDAWRHGQFELRIGDSAHDEIGALAQHLDTIPVALAELVAHRSERAGRNERERIARDLHDTIKQQAFALSLQLGAVHAALPERERELASLREARMLAEQIQRELIDLIDELRPLSQGDWHDHVQARIEDWSRRTGIRVETDLAAAERVLEQWQDVLVRILDEALANVARHSGAGLVRVRLVHEQQRFRLSIADDGHGGIVEGRGRGLLHLRERAAGLPDGRIDWHSDDRGSRVELHWTETVT